MLKQMIRVRQIMRMEQLAGKYSHLLAFADVQKLIDEKESFLDEIEKQEPITEV